MKPVILKKNELKKVLSEFNENTQPHRLIRYLGENPRATRSEIGQKLSISNPSDIALKFNHILRKHGLSIGCFSPPARYENQFGQETNMQEWSLCRLSISELRKPIKGPNRPRVKDSFWKQRAEILARAYQQHRNLGLKKTRGCGV